MATLQATDTRITFRLRSDEKRQIEQAASLAGQTVSDFAVSRLLASAREVLGRHEVLVLSNQARDQLLAALDSEVGPNEELQRAARWYRARRAQGGF